MPTIWPCNGCSAPARFRQNSASVNRAIPTRRRRTGSPSRSCLPNRWPIQQGCPACAEGATCPKCEEEERVQPKEKPGHVPQFNSKAASRITSPRGSGQPLPSSVRASFEPQFGRDLGAVRVHTNSGAQKAAAQLGAEAFTAGSHIAFGEGKYAPDTAAGQRLLAHEVTHVIQQHHGADTGAIQRQVEHDLTQMTVLPELAEALSDEELQLESLRLRERLSELTLGNPEYEAIRQNLHLVESEAARRFVELPAPPAGTEHSFEFQGRVLTADPVSIRYILERIIAGQGGGGSLLRMLRATSAHRKPSWCIGIIGLT